MINQIKTIVLDAGGRYGLHPNWKTFTGELDYYLFEPDPIESKRLAEKYRKRASEVKVIDKALASDNGELTINFFRNRAMSSSVVRNPVSSLFKSGEREREVDIVESINVKAESIDFFSEQNNLKLDFLKLDTEGTEFQILQGAKKQIKENILGVRCEVSFDYIFEGMPLFSVLHEFMLSNDFILLNIDYDGRGDYQNNFVKTNERYGVLTATDAVWVKRPNSLFNSIEKDNESLSIKIMKFASFCFLNHAPDLAINILLEARENYKFDFVRFLETKLYKFLDISIHRLFYSLKWQPGQSLVQHREVFFKIFNKDMKILNDYMESMELNPD